MSRVAAVELVAHGVMCDNCGKIRPVRNEMSRPEGFYMTLNRQLAKITVSTPEELFFCDKNCLVNAMTWSLSHLLTVRT